MNWKQGEDVTNAPSLPDAEAKTLFSRGWGAKKPYLRVKPEPNRQVRQFGPCAGLC